MAKNTDNRNLFEKYHTTATGLSDKEAADRIKLDGPNLIKPKKHHHWIINFFEEFKDLMVIILLVAALLAFIGGESADGAVILFIVVLNATIGFIQKYKAEKAIAALNKMIAPKARVLRNGKEMEIAATDVVRGDIMILREGDQIVADAVLYEANELEAQESALTGESTPVQKFTYDIPQTNDTAADKENMVYMGTSITHGNGMAIVCATGMATQFGRIAQLTTETKKDLSPLERELNLIGLFVGKIALAVAAILLAIGIFIQGKQPIETLLFAAAVAVAAVPEGLPATITIALAIGVQRLARKNAIIKQLSSVETLGATTVICSDKTGTLTKNEMTVKKIYFDRYDVTVQGVGYKPVGSIHIKLNNKPYITIGHQSGTLQDYENQRKSLHELRQNKPELHQALETLMTIAGLCNNANLQRENEEWQVFGDPTEGAILTVVEKSGFDLLEIRDRYRKIHEIAFDSSRKRMSVIVEDKENGKYFVFTKGAPGSIIDICDRVIINNREIKFDKEFKQKFYQKNEAMASSALRGLAFAMRELSPAETKTLKRGLNLNLNKNNLEQNLIFIGLMGMIDPPRPEVKAAVKLAHSAGIRTFIITGDHGLTAEAIARQLNLIGQKKHIILTGEKLNSLSDESLGKQLRNHDLDIIFARVSPQHKLRIVKLLKEQGEIVAVTGDGVNDAPALKRADIGIAMGIAGTDVSKEAANMVLADDSYSTIVTAIKEGRTIYDNLKKFIFYIFSCNFAELLTVFSALILKLPPPLSAILILCVDLGTDVLPAVALGVEPSEPDIMNKLPRAPKTKIINRRFSYRFIYLGIVMGIIVMSVYILTLYRYGWSWGMPLATDNITYLKGASTALVTLIVIQMFNAYNSRSEIHSIYQLGLFSNLYLVGAIAISLALTIAFLEIPLLQKYLGTTSLNLIDWSVIISASLFVLIPEEIRKIFVRRKIKTTAQTS